MARAKGKSICIFSARGGVGKSITALNIAGVLASLKQKILIIDFDLTSGSIATYLNITTSKTIYNFMDDYMNNRFNTVADYTSKYNDNIYVIPSCKDPRQASQININYLNTLLEKARFEYDTIIIDMSHFLNELNISLLDETDLTLLVMNNDLIDLKNMRNLISIFEDAEKTNYKVLLNNSVSLYKNYYSLYDVKNIICHNVDYLVESNFFIKNIDKYISDGIILTLDPKLSKAYPKIYKTYLSIYTDLMEDEDE